MQSKSEEKKQIVDYLIHLWQRDNEYKTIGSITELQTFVLGL